MMAKASGGVRTARAATTAGLRAAEARLAKANAAFRRRPSRTAASVVQKAEAALRGAVGVQRRAGGRVPKGAIG